jgi:hypothetical protein
MKPTVLNVESVTWSRDSHGLFDYESKSVHKETHTLSGDVKLCRMGTETLLMPDTVDSSEDQAQALITLR